jgi:hypothetical protein
MHDIFIYLHLLVLGIHFYLLHFLQSFNQEITNFMQTSWISSVNVKVNIILLLCSYQFWSEGVYDSTLVPSSHFLVCMKSGLLMVYCLIKVVIVFFDLLIIDHLY